jgi:hypothetical protein
LQVFHAFPLYLDDPGVFPDRARGDLLALSIGYVRPLKQNGVAIPVVRRNNAALVPGSLDPTPILVAKMPAESIHSGRLKQATGARSGYLDWSIDYANRPSEASQAQRTVTLG